MHSDTSTGCNYGEQLVDKRCCWGDHVCKDVRTPSIGERLQLLQQDDKTTVIDHAVSIVMAETIVGHVLQKMSHTFWHFVRHSRNVGYEVTERRMFCRGLIIGGDK